MPPTARSLILDLLATLREGAMPVQALVKAGALFGLAENNVRVSLARLRAAGLVESDERGRYRTGRRAAAVTREIASWRRLEERCVRWHGDWVAVHGERGRGRPGRRSSQALRLLGFRTLRPGLELRPDNWVGGVAALRDRLLALGMPDDTLVCGMSELDRAHGERARALWDGEALRAGYATACRELAASSERVPLLDPARAMIETFERGGHAIRQLVLDPLLPDAITPAAERRQLVEALRAYDRLGRSCWADFLARFGVPHRRPPVDGRLAEAAARTADLPLESEWTTPEGVSA